MRLSKRGEYGLRAMIVLTGDPKTDPEPPMIMIKDIAKRENISIKFLGQILVALKNGGLLHSKMGIGGGYYLAKPPSEITLGQIIRILDGPIAPIKCVSQIAYEPCDCPDEDLCGLRMVMFDVREAMVNILDKTTLEEVSTRVEKQRILLGK